MLLGRRCVPKAAIHCEVAVVALIVILSATKDALRPDRDPTCRERSYFSNFTGVGLRSTNPR